MRREDEAESSFLKRKNCNRECAAKSRGVERGQGTRYESRYGGGWIGASQWLAEYICERMAKRNGESLTVRFWLAPTWKREFFKQLAFANRLLKTFEPAAMSKALRSRDGLKVFSFGAKFLVPMIEREQKALERQRLLAPPPAPEPEPQQVDLAPRPTFVERQSAFSKLKGL